ncbi:MAG: ATP-dependent DNA helicase DinG [Methylophagaceae bacterium]
MKMHEDVRSIFDDYKLHLDGFAPRKQQIHAADFVSQSLNNKQSGQAMCVVEAPTGVGKTLAYLAGAIDTAINSKKTLIISTATVNLQQQLINKDLPEFIAATNKKINFVQAKGRGRYVCLRNLQNATEGLQQESLIVDNVVSLRTVKTSSSAKQLRKSFEQKSWDGDRDNWPETINTSVWNAISTDSASCAGKSCNHYKECPYYAMRRKVSGAHIVVANHDLVLSDVELGGGVVLPHPKAAIYVIDEAHMLPNKAIEHATKQLSFAQINQTIETADNAVKRLSSTLHSRRNELQNIIPELRSDLSAVSEHLQQLELLLQSESFVLDLLGGRINEPRLHWGSPLVSAMVLPIEALLQRAVNIVKYFSLFNKWFIDALDKRQITRHIAEIWLPIVGTVETVFSGLIELSMLFLEKDMDGVPPNVRWLSVGTSSKEKTLIINAGPISAAEFLDENIWKKAHGVVLTSATLRGLGVFNKFRGEAGLTSYGSSHFLSVGSPFDYQKQATLSLPRMLSTPNEDACRWQDEVVRKLDIIIDKSEGSLVLFTSNKVMRYVYQKIPNNLRKQVLLQGADLSAKKMVETHKERIDSGRGSIIFGMDRFAEGVDLPGSYCSHVVVTKIPFPVFMRPIEQAKREWVTKCGGNAFTELSLPAASIRIIQACGRLLRKETDMGRITILDSRMSQKSYGKTLMEYLPNYRVVDEDYEVKQVSVR